MRRLVTNSAAVCSRKKVSNVITCSALRVSNTSGVPRICAQSRVNMSFLRTRAHLLNDRTEIDALGGKVSFGLEWNVLKRQWVGVKCLEPNYLQPHTVHVTIWDFKTFGFCWELNHFKTGGDKNICVARLETTSGSTTTIEWFLFSTHFIAFHWASNTFHHLLITVTGSPSPCKFLVQFAKNMFICLWHFFGRNRPAVWSYLTVNYFLTLNELVSYTKFIAARLCLFGWDISVNVQLPILPYILTEMT